MRAHSLGGGYETQSVIITWSQLGEDMPFIVSLFKYIILAVCFLILVAVVLVVFAFLDSSNPLAAGATPVVIGSAFVVLIFLVLNLGGVAILISVHDRHREIAEGIHRIADMIEYR
jgi:hypothetical protein